jgi:hypothetical protein
MLASLAALIPALPLAAALWLGAAILFGHASGEIARAAHQPHRAGGFGRVLRRRR